MNDLRLAIERIARHECLSRVEVGEIFAHLVAGRLDDIQLAALLLALRTRGEDPVEIAGAAEALRRAARPFPRPEYGYADSCGTGGDESHTINISTAVALVVAEAGLPVAKHGNRSVSSRCGSADVLESLGIPMAQHPDEARRCLDEASICFLYAPHYHEGLRHAMRVRTALRVRTIFNLLGPLVNPAAPAFQVVGVYDPAWCEPLARTLGLLGCQSAMVVHGSGLDEMAIHGPTTVAWWREGEVMLLSLKPSDAGLPEHALADLQGDDAASNARTLLDLFAGRGRPAHRDAVALNAGALLWAAGRARTLREGTSQALEILSTDRALRRLARWKECCHAA